MKLGRFLTPFLKSEDITEPITATITKIVVEEVRGQDGKIKKNCSLYLIFLNKFKSSHYHLLINL